MKNLLNSQRIEKIWHFFKPILTVLVVFAILRYTGLLSGISQVAGSALLETGWMDVQPEDKRGEEKEFDYDFTIKDLEGNEVSVSDYKGKVIFLNMWATWCGPCRVEMPSIQNLYDKLDHNKIAFVMLSLDTNDNQQKVVKYISDKGFTFPVFQPVEYLPKQLQVPSIPTTFIIGKDGKVKLKKVGTANYDTEDFRKFLEDLSNE